MTVPSPTGGGAEDDGDSSEPQEPRPRSIPVEDRPADATPIHTEDLPDTPQRDSAIEATAWVEAPAALRSLGDDIGAGPARFLRRIGPWLLWRAGPPRGADARYWVARADDLSSTHTFHLHPDGTGKGTAVSGVVHTRFRTWKEDLRDHPDP